MNGMDAMLRERRLVTVSVVVFAAALVLGGSEFAPKSGEEAKAPAIRKKAPYTPPSVSSPSAMGKMRSVVQLGHSKLVSSVAFSPDGRRALSGSVDKKIT